MPEVDSKFDASDVVQEPEVVLPLKFHRDSARIISIPSGEGKVVLVSKSGVYRLEDDMADMFLI